MKLRNKYMEDAGKKVLDKIFDEIEIFLLLPIFAIWYLFNIKGAFSSDEVLYATSGYTVVTGKSLYVDIALEHPLLAQYFIGSSELLFGQTSFGARFPSFIFGILTLYLTYKIGRKLVNRYAGFFAAVLTGIIPVFAHFTIKAMLDMTLVFFVTLLFYIFLIYLEVPIEERWKRNKFALFLGIISMCAFNSKQTAIFFIFVVFSLLLLKDRSSLKFLILGYIIATLIIYVPYLKIDYVVISGLVAENLPKVAGHDIYLSPRILQLASLLPYLPAIFYVFSYSFMRHFVHSISGHSAVIAGTVYQHHPWWAHFYWIWVNGGIIFAICLSISLIFIGWTVLKKKYEVGDYSLWLYLFIPFLFFSMMTIKFEYYILPLYPFMSILIVTSIYKIARIFFKKEEISSRIATIGLIILLLLPTSPLISAIKNPDIRTDTGLDVAAQMIVNYAKENNENMVTAVICEGPIVYYIKDMPPNLHLKKYYYYSPELYEEIKEGKIDLVIDYDPYPRYADSEIREYVKANAKSKELIKNNLYMYILK